MLDGKLRIAPTCYHVLHLLPVMSAHEMNFFTTRVSKPRMDRLLMRSCMIRWYPLVWRSSESPRQ